MHLAGAVEVADSRWTVDCVPMAAYLARQKTWGPVGALLAGVIVSALLVGYLVLLTGRTARVEQLVAKRTRELHEEQRLMRDMLDLHERERKLVAYEIHDGLAQQLTAAIYKFHSVGRLREEDPAAADKLFAEAVQLLREAMTETRRLISGLRPPVLDDEGVVPAIDYLIADHQQHGGPEIEFVHRKDFDRLAPPLESAVFRIVQECLTNACRYSQSAKMPSPWSKATGRCGSRCRTGASVSIRRKFEHDHFGLQGIRERARLLGGGAAIQAAPQRGTHITVELPAIAPRAENGPA